MSNTTNEIEPTELAPQPEAEAMPVDTAPTHIESGPFSTEGTYHGDPARFRGAANEGAALVEVLGTGITQVTYIDGPEASSESPKP